MNRIFRKSRKVAIGIAGGLVVIIGLILVPYPGPGWLMVFAGLAILSIEFDRARKVLDVAEGKYRQWQQWLSDQSKSIKFIVWFVTAIVVVITIWLLNGYGMINNFFNLGQDWINSPLF